MFLVHSFRLRDPWQFDRSADHVRWSRIFHRPSGLEPLDALWLVVSGLPPEASLFLNDRPLQPAVADRPGEFVVTGMVSDASRIEIVVPCETVGVALHEGKFPYDVRLGIVGE